MRGWAGLIGTFLPFAILILASWSPLRGKKLWIFSLLANLVSWACFVFVLAGYYTKEITEAGSILSPVIIGNNVWSGDLFLRWDFQSSLLSLAAATVVVSFHFLSRSILESSRASVAALGSYLGCLFGALGSGHLFLFSIFFAGSLLPRFVFTGIEAKSEKGIDAIKETAFLGIVALFSLFVVVLAFYGPFREGLGGWFQLSSATHVVLPGAIGFSLLLFAAAIAAGLFPFHGNTRKIYEMESMDRAVPLALQPLFGFTILFRFAVELFPGEFLKFHDACLGFFAVGLSYGALSFLGSKGARSRAFWLQQIMCFLIAIGFFSLNRTGWHGASALLFFQCLALPFLLSVLTCHERREPLPTIQIANYPIFALSTVWAVLIALFLPVSIGFYGLLLVIWSLVPAKLTYLPFVVISVPVIVFAGMRSMFFHLGERQPGIPGGKFHELTYEEILAMLPIGVILLFLGLMPKVLMGPLGVSASALLRGMGIVD